MRSTSDARQSGSLLGHCFAFWSLGIHLAVCRRRARQDRWLGRNPRAPGRPFIEESGAVCRWAQPAPIWMQWLGGGLTSGRNSSQGSHTWSGRLCSALAAMLRIATRESIKGIEFYAARSRASRRPNKCPREPRSGEATHLAGRASCLATRAALFGRRRAHCATPSGALIAN